MASAESARSLCQDAGLLELVKYVHDVIPDHEQRRNPHQPQSHPQDRLNFVDLGHNRSLLGSLMIKRVVEEDLVLFVLLQTGAVDIQRYREQHHDSPGSPNHWNDCHTPPPAVFLVPDTGGPCTQTAVS